MQVSTPERFGQVVVHTGGDASFAVSGHGVGRHGNDPGMTIGVSLSVANPPGGLQSVQYRHLHVHQDRVEVPATPAGNPLFAVRGNRYHVPGLPEQGHCQLLIDDVILDQQDLQRTRRARPEWQFSLGRG